MMTQHHESTDPRIRVKRRTVHIWTAQVEGQGSGPEWGIALAALDFRSHDVVEGTPPTFYLHESDLRRLRIECERIGVRVEDPDVRVKP